MTQTNTVKVLDSVSKLNNITESNVDMMHVVFTNGEQKSNILVISGDRQSGKTRRMINIMLGTGNHLSCNQLYVMTYREEMVHFFKQEIIRSTLPEGTEYTTKREDVDKVADSITHSKIGIVPTYLSHARTNDVNKLLTAAKYASEANKIHIYVDDCSIELFNQLKLLDTSYVTITVAMDIELIGQSDYFDNYLAL